LDVRFHPKIGDLLAEVYFALTDAYKAAFLSPGRRTEARKIAALTCASIAAVQPLRPPASTIEREEYLYINPMFAMRCACAIVDHPWHKRAFDERRRFCKALMDIRLPCTDDMIADANANDGVILLGTYSLDLSPPERAFLHMLIGRFEVLEQQKIYVQTEPDQFKE
jgi:hypothetical protein